MVINGDVRPASPSAGEGAAVGADIVSNTNVVEYFATFGIVNVPATCMGRRSGKCQQIGWVTFGGWWHMVAED